MAISEKIGLTKILADVFPNDYKSIITLACYLLSNKRAVMHCDRWLNDNDGFNITDLSSQRISDLLISFDSKEMMHFYKQWHKLISENELIALDTTSISTYSKKMKRKKGKGYNRDKEKLAQVNLCLLYGQDSKLPIYHSTYHGSIPDISTLETTISEFFSINGGVNIFLVMDKGFCSQQNLDLMLNSDKIKFLTSIPFTNKFALELIGDIKGIINHPSRIIFTKDKSPIRGIHKIIEFGEKKVQLHAHIFCNTAKVTDEENKLFGEIKEVYNSIIDKKLIKNNKYL